MYKYGILNKAIQFTVLTSITKTFLYAAFIFMIENIWSCSTAIVS